MPIFDLKKNLVFYGAYHREPTNIAIHVACVPILLGTAFVFGSNTPSFKTPGLLTRLGLPLNLGTLASLTYSTLYLVLSPNAAGIATTPLLLSAASLANKLSTRYDRTKVNTIAVGVHIVHGFFNSWATGALFLAPLFVWYEVLFKFGFYEELQREVEEGIEVEIKNLEAGKKAE